MIFCALTAPRCRIWAAAVALALAGCAAAPSQLVVVIDSDLALPAELASVRVTSLHEDVVVSRVTFAVAETATGAASTLPFSLGIVPLQGDSTRRVRVVVEALDALGTPVVETHAVVGFLQGRSLRLPMFLARSCIAIECPADQTCTRNGCVAEAIDPEDLEPAIPHADLTRDGGYPDVGAPDAHPTDVGSRDGGLRDGGAPDVGSPDGGAPVAPTCTACDGMGFPCESTCADGETCRCGAGCPCSSTCPEDAGCDFECRGAASCTLLGRRAAIVGLVCAEGASCALDARSATEVAASCVAGTSCHVGCRDVGSCSVACTGGAHCTVDCNGSASCRFTTCEGGITACRGNVLACNALCP